MRTNSTSWLKGIREIEMWEIKIEFPSHPIDLWEVREILLASLSKREMMEFTESLVFFHRPMERALDEFELVMES